MSNNPRFTSETLDDPFIVQFIFTSTALMSTNRNKNSIAKLFAKLWQCRSYDEHRFTDVEAQQKVAINFAF